MDVAGHRDRLSWLWLGVGFALSVIANGMFSVPAAAWLAPVFIVRFLRTRRPLPGLAAAYAALTAAFLIGWRPAFVDAGAMFSLYAAFFALVCFLPYVIDRLLAPRIGGFAGTLVLPVAWVATEYVLHLVSPLGTFFALPYTQSGNLPLLQMMAVTGLWGVSFLVTWLAGVANWAWEHGFDMQVTGRGVLAYAGITLGVLLLGGLRLALFPPSGPTVRAAAITTSVDREVIPEPDSPRERRLIAGALTEEDRSEMTADMEAISADLLKRTREQARSGARIVTWNEYNAHAWSAGAEELVSRARELAREEGIWLTFPLAVIEPEPAKRPAPERVVVNESVMITPGGALAYTYVKHNLLIGWESEHAVRGPRAINAIETPVGTLSSVICLDMEFPDYMRLAGRRGVDIMLGGAIDGTPSSRGNPMHSIMASYRAIEEGFSLVRAGNCGRNAIVDYQGRVLAQAGHYTSDRVAEAPVPTQGVRTPYSVLGDWFAWLCLAALAALGATAIARRRPSRSRGAS